MIVLMVLNGSFAMADLAGASIVAVLFAVPVALNLGFGGGDIRYGFFCALFTGLEGIGWFVLIAAAIHLLVLAIRREHSAGFAPAMSIGALVTKSVVL